MGNNANKNSSKKAHDAVNYPHIRILNALSFVPESYPELESISGFPLGDEGHALSAPYVLSRVASDKGPFA